MHHSPTIDTEWEYKNCEAAVLENEYLRIVVLPGKGTDILEFRDKRRDVDVLFDAPGEWTPPAERAVPAAHETTWQTDCYPGGWQLNLPIAGGGTEIDGAAYGIHGESALRPWEANVAKDDGEAVRLDCECELLRYPFQIERSLTLPAGEPRLEIEETVKNVGQVDLEYLWQQHVALGAPLLSPAARIDVPARSGGVEHYGEGNPNARLKSDAAFEWPDAPRADGEGTVDLESEIPEQSANTTDVAFATGLEEGWCALTNSDLDLGFALTFPTDPFECVWYWGAFGGQESSAFYGRNYNLGLEPTTAYPGGDLFDAQRENGTIDVLDAGESVSASYVARTYTGYERVDSVSPEGLINGQ